MNLTGCKSIIWWKERSDFQILFRDLYQLPNELTNRQLYVKNCDLCFGWPEGQWMSRLCFVNRKVLRLSRKTSFYNAVIKLRWWTRDTYVSLLRKKTPWWKESYTFPQLFSHISWKRTSEDVFCKLFVAISIKF